MASTKIEQTLQELGLTPGETKVYLALLKLGRGNVHQLKRETNIHRTTIYDFLESLSNKGLVSSVVEKGMHMYSASHPRQLFELLENKKDYLSEIFEDLVQLTKTERDEIKIEVYRGKEGFRRSIAELLKRREEVLGFGVDESVFEEKVGLELRQYFKKGKIQDLKERIITWEGAPFVYDLPHIMYRCVPKEFFGPTPHLIAGDLVWIQIWEPLTIILINSKTLADAYRKHFELLWQTAKPMGKEKMRALNKKEGG